MDRISEATVAAIRKNIANIEQAALGPEYTYQSLPLCIIDAVFSIGVRYSNAQKAVRSWCGAQVPPWPIHRSDLSPPHKISEFLRITNGVEGVELSRRFFGGNRQRTSPKSGILKADAVVHFARALHRCGIDDFADILDGKRVARARSSVGAIPGQGSGLSFDYLLMLAGDDGGVKADRMIRRFVADAAGQRDISPAEATRAVVEATNVLALEYRNLTPRLLDRLIWGYQSAQRDGNRKYRQRLEGRAEAPLTIEEARRRLALTFGVQPSNIKIVIEKPG